MSKKPKPKQSSKCDTAAVGAGAKADTRGVSRSYNKYDPAWDASEGASPEEADT